MSVPQSRGTAGRPRPLSQLSQQQEEATDEVQAPEELYMRDREEDAVVALRRTRRRRPGPGCSEISTSSSLSATAGASGS